MQKYLVLILSFLFLVACSKNESHEWCTERSIAQILELEGTTPTTSWCSTVLGDIVFKTTDRCRTGAYYIEDETGEMFLCNPNADEEGEVFECHKKILDLGTDTNRRIAKKVELEYFPARELCGGKLKCECQNGFSVLYVGSP
ncbi:MAG: hypothetical protein GX801_04315 [Fibrobacter sp.]|nr:hypothetical protein [Fibrobacter sp.]